MLTSIGAALGSLTALQVVCVVAITLLIVATPVAIYQIVKRRAEIGTSIGNFTSKLKRNPKLAAAES